MRTRASRFALAYLHEGNAVNEAVGHGRRHFAAGRPVAARRVL
jgi:hypothetical protein